MVNNKQITICEKIGNQTFRHIAEIADDDFPGELQKVMEVLRLNNIVVDSVDGIDDREMYRFITQELILEKIDDNLPKNMITCFIYEEFYPNDDADMRKHSNEFLNCLIDKEKDYFETFLFSGKDEGEEKEVYAKKLRRRLNLFRDAFDDIRIEEFKIQSVSLKEFNGVVTFDYSLAVLPPESKTFHRISGNGKFSFIKEWDFWSIEKIEMKGVV
jgi:hypothetical protein